MANIVNTASVNLVGTSAGIRAGWVKRRAKGGLLGKSKAIRRKVYRKTQAMK